MLKSNIFIVVFNCIVLMELPNTSADNNCIPPFAEETSNPFYTDALAFQEYRLYSIDGSCHKLNGRGPCSRGKTLIFAQHPLRGMEDFGMCQCRSRPRLHVYVPENDGCFPVFHQGPCSEGQWLVVNEMAADKGTRASCVPNLCYDQSIRDHPRYKDGNSEHFYFYHYSFKQCFKSHTQGYCGHSHTLQPNGTFYPSCKPEFEHIGNSLDSLSVLARDESTNYNYYSTQQQQSGSCSRDSRPHNSGKNAEDEYWRYNHGLNGNEYQRISHRRRHRPNPNNNMRTRVVESY